MRRGERGEVWRVQPKLQWRFLLATAPQCALDPSLNSEREETGRLGAIRSVLPTPYYELKDHDAVGEPIQTVVRTAIHCSSTELRLVACAGLGFLDVTFRLAGSQAVFVHQAQRQM